jgi:hypothetical protein
MAVLSVSGFLKRVVHAPRTLGDRPAPFSGLGPSPAANSDEAVVWARVLSLSHGYTRKIYIGTRFARRWARGYPAHLGRDVPMAWVYFGVIVVFFAASIGLTVLLERLRRGS